MIKSRKVQLVFLTVASIVGVLTTAASMGLFEATFRWDFYIYFSNVSNYFCVALMLAELVQVLRSSEDGYINVCPGLKFTGLVAICLTFIVFTAVMAPTKTAQYLLSFRSLSLHLFVPVFYVLDWLLFYEHGKIGRKTPLLSVAFLLSYILFVFLHAAVLRFDSSILCFAGDAPLIYPYFFLNYENLGIKGLITWVPLIILVYVAVGYLFYLIDIRLARKRTPR